MTKPTPVSTEGDEMISRDGELNPHEELSLEWNHHNDGRVICYHVDLLCLDADSHLGTFPVKTLAPSPEENVITVDREDFPLHDLNKLLRPRSRGSSYEKSQKNAAEGRSQALSLFLRITALYNEGDDESGFGYSHVRRISLPELS